MHCVGVKSPFPLIETSIHHLKNPHDIRHISRQEVKKSCKTILPMIYYFSNNTVNHKEVTQLPNIKSSIRSVKTDAERRAKNFAVKSQIRTATRKTVEAAQAGAVEEAKKALVHATSVIDKAASKGILHKNTAARKKSNLAAKVNAL